MGRFPIELELSLAKLQKDVHNAFRSWHEADIATSPLDYLQLFQQAQLKGANNARRATNEILLNALKVLAVDHKRDADLLRKHFLDGLLMHGVANWLNVSESTAYKMQKEAVQRLTATLYALERQARDEYQAGLEKQLKLPPQVQLIGVAEHLANLLEVLIVPGPPWFMSIEGLGGIGKTALTNALIRQFKLSSRFQTMAWVSAKQQNLLPGLGFEPIPNPALDINTLTDALLEQLDSSIPLTQSPQQKRAILTGLLKKAPQLIIVDNLETVADYQTLLPFLRELANPSKFLLTSRHSLQAYSDVFCLSLEELNRADTIRFIRYEAKVRGLAMLANASETHLKSIYGVVGGNPLALKLVIGQTSILSLSQILESLKQAKGKTIDDLYTYIYWQAWHMLDLAAQKVFLMMPLAQDGNLDQLATLTQLELDELSQALQQLVRLSLVQVGGDLEERRYTIHRLTETFLLNEAIKWKTSI